MLAKKTILPGTKTDLKEKKPKLKNNNDTKPKLPRFITKNSKLKSKV